jgi:hypothetical protein
LVATVDTADVDCYCTLYWGEIVEIDTSAQKVITYLLLSITPIMTAIVGAYARSILKRVDKIEDIERKTLELSERLSSIAVIKEEWVTIKIELTKLILQIEQLRKAEEEIIIIKRDMATIWKNVDKIKDAVFDMDYRGGNT